MEFKQYKKPGQYVASSEIYDITILERNGEFIWDAWPKVEGFSRGKSRTTNLPDAIQDALDFTISEMQQHVAKLERKKAELEQGGFSLRKLFGLK